jgi:hypothetical protein
MRVPIAEVYQCNAEDAWLEALGFLQLAISYKPKATSQKTLPKPSKILYTGGMDVERITHMSYKKSMWVALVLSGLAVTLAALLGRGALNLRGALVLPEPDEVTVIAALYEAEKLEENGPIVIDRIEFLREEEDDQSDRPTYAYLVSLSNDENYLTKISWRLDQWSLTTYERLH